MSIEDKIKKGQQEMIEDGVDWNHKLNQLEKQLEGSNEAERLSLKLILIWLFIAIAVVLSVAWYFNKPTKQPTQDLFMAYYEIAPALFETMQRNNTTTTENNNQTKAHEAYVNRRYEEARQYWTLAQKESANDQEIRTYIAISSIELHEAEKAIPLLKQITDAEYQDVATWYLALAQIKTNKLDSARLTLLSITKNQEHYKHSSAIKLLNEVDRLINRK